MTYRKPGSNKTTERRVSLARFLAVLMAVCAFTAMATPWTNCFRVVEYSSIRHLQCTVEGLQSINFSLNHWDTNNWQVIDHGSGGSIQIAPVSVNESLSMVAYHSGYTEIEGRTQPFRFAFKWNGENIGIRWVYHGWISVARVDDRLVILGSAMDREENDLRVGDGELPIPGGGGQEGPEDPDEGTMFSWDYCRDRHGVRLVYPCVPPDTAGRIDVPATINGLPVVEIGSSAFVDCTNITEVIVPNGVTNIESAAFYRCERLHSVELPDSIAAIEADAFGRCEALRRVEVPIRANLRRNAFMEDCEVVRTYPWENAYRSVTQQGEATVATADGDWRVIDNGDSLTLDWKCLSNRVAGVVAIPSTIGGKSVVAMGEGAFYCNDQIEGLAIPLSISNIGDKAISECRNLPRLAIPESVTNIEFGGVSHNENLGELVVEANLDEIAAETFAGNWNLTNLVLKGEIGTIRGWAFDDCVRLEQVVVFPGVARIERDAFITATSLKSVVVPYTTVVEDGAFPAGCEIVRMGPRLWFYDDDGAFRYEDHWLAKLLGSDAWGGVGTIRARVEGGSGSADDEDLVRICNVLGVGPVRTVRQKDGTLDAYFAMPTICIESFDVRTWTFAVRVVPPVGAQIVHAPDIAPLDSEDVFFIDAAYELEDFVNGRSCLYIPGKDDIAVSVDAYVEDGRIDFALDDYFVGKDYHFYRIDVRPKKWWSK